MGICKKNQKALQVLENGSWQWVFCYNDIQYGGVVTTKNRQKALHGEHALAFFRNRYGNQEFRLERDGEKVD